ncbi:hypothetical protein [Synechocystis sp. PCC 7509]|uniref:hypothetical protein n=1 Tax=Synechocystis sp. PCC 7509 TaxID=927677 RepID=UPI0002AC1F0A|nr:hypothetical protein [Synechocystis sp. PCC 7509]
MSEEIDMQAIKAAAKKELGDISGIEGFGISDRSLNIYTNNEEVKKQIPTNFHGVPVNCIVTGTIYTQI